VVVEGSLPRGLGVVDGCFRGVVEGAVLGPGPRGGFISEVMRPSSGSGEASLYVGCEVFCCEEEFRMTAIRDGVRSRDGVAGVY
jgi:hypothetical protein